MTRMLLLVSAMVGWGLPGLAIPGTKPLPTCACKIQPTPNIIGWLDPLPESMALRFSPYTTPPPTWLPEADHQIAEGPPADDKGTPGNRGGQCRQNQCTSQAPPERNPVVAPK